MFERLRKAASTKLISAGQQCTVATDRSRVVRTDRFLSLRRGIITWPK